MQRLIFTFILLWLTLLLACGDDEASPSNGNNGNNNQNPDSSASGSGTLAFQAADGQAPALNPTLVGLTRVGGKGDQYIRSLSSENGLIDASGEGFSLLFQLSSLSFGLADGSDIEIDDTESYEKTQPLPGDPGRKYVDDRIGLDFRVGFRQAGGNLQMPIFRAFMGDERQWSLWGHAVKDVEDRGLGADTRCYQAWGMPEGRIGVQCWSDGGNSVLGREPRDLNQNPPAWLDGSYRNSPGGVAFALVNPADGGSAESGTFIGSHVGPVVTDGWGRVYSGRVNPNLAEDSFQGQSASVQSGLLILDPSMKKVLFQASIGGDECKGDKGFQSFLYALQVDKYLALAGSICSDATLDSTDNAFQNDGGGGQDGWVAVVQLW